MWKAKYLALDYLPDPLQLHQMLYDARAAQKAVIKKCECGWSVDTHSLLSNHVVTQYIQ